MSSEHTPDAIRRARADHEARTRSHVRNCVSLAVVTSQDIAASLIDRAITLSGSPAPPERD